MEWRDIEGWPYLVSEDGQIKRGGNPGPGIKVGVVLRQAVNKRTHYAHVTLWDRSRSLTVSIHPIVARAFIGPPPTPAHEVSHRDGNKLNNRWTNLEWLTRQGNVAHADSLGLRRLDNFVLKGEKNRQAKLRNKDIPSIRRSLKSGVRVSAIAKQYGVSSSAITLIERGITWRDF